MFTNIAVQAWVVFADVGAATNAMKGMQSFALYEKPIVSTRIVRPCSRALSPVCTAPSLQKIQYARSKSHAIEKLEGSYRPRPKRAREEEPARESGGASKRSRTAEGPASAAPSAQAAAQQQQAALPSTKLLVQNLPALAEDVLTGMVKELFGRYPGLTDVRVVAPRRLAFVEYAHESASAPALAGLHGFLYDGTNGLQVTYAR